jgi:hypothetical protein
VSGKSPCPMWTILRREGDRRSNASPDFTRRLGVVAENRTSFTPFLFTSLSNPPSFFHPTPPAIHAAASTCPGGCERVSVATHSPSADNPNPKTFPELQGWLRIHSMVSYPSSAEVCHRVKFPAHNRHQRECKSLQVTKT